MASLDLDYTDRLLGLFEPDHLNYENDRSKDCAGEPSLADMTRAATTVLRRNPKGFVLVVEGGRIDHAHHVGDDVGIWARGPGADAVRGSLEQNVIVHLMVQAQPDLVKLLCAMGDCEQGVPVRRPNYELIRQAPRHAQAR